MTNKNQTSPPRWARTLSRSLYFLSLLMACMLWTTGAMAQLAIKYSLSKTVGTYSSISGTGTSVAVAGDDVAVNITGLPGFTVNGVSYTNARMGSNGWIILYNTTAPTLTGNYTPLSTASGGGTSTVVIAPFGRDLDRNNFSGTAWRQQIGNELIFEWKDYNRYLTSSERLNFQVRLDVVTGSITFVYGTIIPGSKSTYPQVGWKTNGTVASNWATDINNLMLDVTGSPNTCNWSNTVTGNSNTSTVYINSANSGVIPASGLTFTWTPQSAPEPVRTFSAVSGITSNSATLTWTAPTGATQYNVSYRAVGSCSWTSWSGNPAMSATATLTGLTAGTYYQYMVQASDGSNNSIYSHIPDAAGSGNGYTATGSFQTTITCQAPTSPTGSATTATTANISWTAPGIPPSNGYQYAVTTSATPPGSGTPFAGTSTSVSGLTANTTYYLHVRSDCGAGDYSSWATSAAFTTPCNPSSLPWTENFDGVTIPAFPSCWKKENGDWGTTNNSSSSFDADARSGTQFLRDAYSATNEYMWTPGFTMTAGNTYEFKFWWAGDNYSGWTGDVFVNSAQNSSGATQLGTSFVTSGTTTTKTYVQETYSFTPGTTGDYYFAIRVNATGVPWYLSFDDFEVVELPLCSGTPAPGNTNASSTTICSGGTANLSLQNDYSGFIGITYQWYNSSGAIGGATSSTYTTPPLFANETYWCEVTCSAGPSTGTSNSVTITIGSPPVGGTASGPSTGVTYQNLNYTVTGYNGSLQWQSSTDNITFNDIPSANTPSVNLIANAAGTFYIRCKAYNPGCPDDFSNVITVVVTVAGDNVCNANVLTVGANNGPYTNVGATSETGEVTPPGTGCSTQTGWCGTGFPINSVWFSFTPPASAKYSFHLVNSLFDSEFALYSASSCSPFSGFTLIAANDDSSSSPYHSYIAPVCLTAGQTYYFLVDGYYSTTASGWGILVNQETTEPTATISGSGVGCVNSPTAVQVNFTGTGPWTYNIAGSGGPYLGTAPTSPATIPVTPTASGTQNYTLTSIADNTCPSSPSTNVSGTATFNVSTAPPTQAVTMPFTGMPSNACPGTTANLSIPAVANATTYTWDGPPGTTFDGNASPYTSSSPNAAIVFGTPNTSMYQIGVQAGNGCGNSLRKVQKVRYSVSVPSAVNGDATVCPNTSGKVYSIPSASEGATSYQWTITGDASINGSGNTVNTSSLSVTIDFGPSWAGGTLCVTAKTSCYTSASKCLAIGMSSGNFGIITGSTTACPNTIEPYAVIAGTGIASYNWTVPTNASVSSGQGTNNISVNFAPGYNNVGNICVTATSICGVVSAPKCRTVAPGVAKMPTSISGNTNGLCGSLGVTYSTPIVPGVSTYNWTVPSGASIASGQGTNSISVDYTSFTNGQVCVSATNGCGTSASRCIVVKGAPSTPASITANPATWCANDLGIDFTANVSNVTGIYTLSWAYPNTTTYVSGGGNSTSLTLDWGASNGVVMVTASNACGNGTATLSSNLNCRESEISASALNVYPNPTAGMLNVEYTTNKGTAQVTVLDLSGRVVMTQTQSASEGRNTMQLDLSRVAKGAYMLNVQTQSGNNQVRIVVE